MPQVCTVCQHPHREAINASLCVGSGTGRGLAARYGLSEAAVRRHRAEHLPAELVKGQEARQEAQALDVVRQLQAINGASLEVLKQARDAKDGDLALKAVDRIQKQIELQAKLLGELAQEGTVNLIVAPEWIALRGRILVALAPFPEARLALAEALDAGD